ncbi:unnamed protein product [Spirodela intermedia]|uniref:Uncharacterized protein n=1 Tax=Spirodela intermedia TaxID=51605 RepID=A0A7I8L7Q1_SPIIN|nr:unnamed protein product [Spirodela intermedia]
MGLLDKLWDDTVAGPRPESGLGKLRKYSNFVAPRIDTSIAGDMGRTGGGEDSPEATPRVTRSIMIKRPSGSPAATPPESPAGSTPPLSPFFGKGGGGRREWNRFRRKSTSDAYDRAAAAGGSGGGVTPTAAAPSSRPSFPPFEV